MQHRLPLTQEVPKPFLQGDRIKRFSRPALNPVGRSSFMEPCPDCGCPYIGTDVLYAQGVAMFCQECGRQGERIPIAGPRTQIGDASVPDFNEKQLAEEEARASWNQAAQAKKLRSLYGGYEQTETHRSPT